MRHTITALSTLVGSSLAFHAAIHPNVRRPLSLNPLFESVAEEAAAPYDIEDSVFDLKQDLIDVAQSLKNEFGALIIDSSAQEKLKNAAMALEKSSEPPVDTSAMVGEWTLLCSTASAEKVKGIDTSKLPFFNADLVKEVRKTLNKSLEVQQVIKSEGYSGIDRVDHVIQYMPPNALSEFVSDLPDFLQSLNINPLEVTKQKVVLIHKAEIESTIPYIKTKLSLQSVVVNVAGKSQSLDPAGADILGINVPFGEILNAGTFETTYMDSNLRISRSKVGPVEQLRVFMRTTPAEEAIVPVEVEVAVVEPIESVESDDREIEAPSDVEEAEFVNEAPVEESDEGEIEAPSDVESED